VGSYFRTLGHRKVTIVGEVADGEGFRVGVGVFVPGGHTDRHVQLVHSPTKPRSAQTRLAVEELRSGEQGKEEGGREGTDQILDSASHRSRTGRDGLLALHKPIHMQSRQSLSSWLQSHYTTANKQVNTMADHIIAEQSTVNDRPLQSPSRTNRPQGFDRILQCLCQLPGARLQWQSRPLLRLTSRQGSEPCSRG